MRGGLLFLQTMHGLQHLDSSIMRLMMLKPGMRRHIPIQPTGRMHDNPGNRQLWNLGKKGLRHIESHEFSLVSATGTVLEMEISGGAFLDRFLLVTFF